MSITRAVYREKLKQLKSTLGNKYKAIPETRTAKVIGPTLVEINGQFYNARVNADPGTMVTVTNIGRPASAIYATTEGGVFSTTITAGSSSGSGGGGATVDTTQFVWRDGRYSLTGNLLVSPGVTIDGVDLSAHVIDPDAHHTQIHDVVGTDHTIIGSAFDVVGATSTNTIGLITPSAAPGAVEALLKSTSAGQLTLPLYVATTSVTSPIVTSPLINTSSGSMTLAPVGDLLIDPTSDIVQMAASAEIKSSSYASQTTGWRVTYDGQADFRYLFVDEMHAKAFIADLEQALAGGQIITKSVATLALDFTAPAAGGVTTMTMNDLPSATGMAVFQDGDIVRLREFSRAGGSLSISNCWGTVVLDTTYGVSGFDSATKTQRFTFTRSTGGNAGAMSASTVVAADAIVLDYGVSGNGFYEVNAIDGVYGANSPYMQIVTWTTHPATGSSVRLRTGNLNGLSIADYGIRMGTDVSAAATTTFDFRASTGTVTFGPVGAGKPNLHFDGSDLELRQNTTAVISLDSTGDSYFSGVMTIGTSGEIRQGTGSLGTDYTGLRIWSDSSIGRIAGYNSNTLQWYAYTDGRLYAGGGVVVLDANGVTIDTASGAIDDTYAYTFDYSGFTTGGLYASSLSGQAIYLVANASATADSLVEVIAYGHASNEDASALLRVESGDGLSEAYVQAQIAAGTPVLNLVSDGAIVFHAAVTAYETIAPNLNDYADIGSSSKYFLNAYIRNLYTDTIVGTPSYSHTHAASDIASGTLDLARIPATLTGKDADTVDGSHASAFALLSATQTWTGSNTFTNAIISNLSTASSVIRASNASATAGTATNIQIRRARGTIGTETATQSADLLGFISFRGYGATAWATAGADIRGYAAQSMTDSAWGTRLQFHTVTNSSTSSTEKMRLTNDGVLLINETAAVGSEKLRVNGSIYADSTITGTTAIYVGANAVWHAGNDGAGSGLDADTLDTYQATAFGRLAAANVWTSTNDFQGNVTVTSGATLTVGSNTDINTILGRGVVGYAIAADHATFAHFDANSATAYAIGQDANGRTRVNAASGQPLTFHIAGAEIGRFAATGELLIGNTSLYGSEALSVWGGLYVSADVDLTGNIGNPTYTSQTTGWQITDVGGADFRSIYADEMVVKSFISDLEQALAGGQIVSKSVAILSRDWVAPVPGTPVRLYVKDLPSASDMAVFQANDYIRLRAYNRSAGALTVTDCWGVVTSYTDQVGGEQYWTFTRSGAVTNNTIAQVGTATTATTGGATSLTITKVTGTASGHMMVNNLVTASSVVITPPSGWTLIDSTAIAGVVVSAYYKVAGGSEPANYTWNFDSSVNAAGCIGCYSNVGSVVASKISLNTTSSSTSFVGSTIELISEKSMVLFLGGVASNSSSTAPSGMTERVDTGTGSVRVYMAEQLFAVSGFTGTKTGTISSSQNNAVIMLELSPTHTVTNTNGGAITGGSIIEAESLALDYGVSGNGYYEVSAIDGTYGANSPYSQIVTWTTHPATGQVVRTRTGNLYGLFATANEYGFYAGNGTADTNSYIRMSNSETVFNNVDLSLYDGSTWTIRLDKQNGLNLLMATSGSPSLTALTWWDSIPLGNSYAIWTTTDQSSKVTMFGYAYGKNSSYQSQVQMAAYNYNSTVFSGLLFTTPGTGSATIGDIYANTLWIHGSVIASDGVDIDMNANNIYDVGQLLAGTSSESVSQIKIEAVNSSAQNVIRSRAQTSGGISIQSLVLASVGSDRGGLYHNAYWDEGAALWQIQAIGANDAGAVHFNNGSTISFIVHTSTGTSARTMSHATFTAGEVLELSSTAATFSVDLDLNGNDISDTGVVYVNGATSFSGALNVLGTTLNGADSGVRITPSTGSVTHFYYGTDGNHYIRSASSSGFVALQDSGGNVGIGQTSPTAKLDINGNTIRLRGTRTPSSASASGNAGDFCYDSSYFYICIATNTWRRTAHATW